jgi:hypothetical protein
LIQSVQCAANVEFSESQKIDTAFRIIQERLNGLEDQFLHWLSAYCTNNNASNEAMRPTPQIQDRIARLELENAALGQRIARLEEENAHFRATTTWFRPLSVALAQSFSDLTQNGFHHCLTGWNTTLELPGEKKTYKSDPIPVTVADRWILCGKFLYTGRPDMMNYVGLDCFIDCEGQRQIGRHHVTCVTGTDAVLAEDCKPNTRVVKVRGAASWPEKFTKWRTSQSTECVAFGPNVLPNFNTSSRIHKWVQNGDILEIELTENMCQLWPAGTPVRLHRRGATYIYGLNGCFRNTWMELEMKHDTHRLHVGTNSVRIIVMTCQELQNWREQLDTTGCSM